MACEGAKTLVDWGFEKAGYDRITACTAVENLASRRVMEKIGMTHLRTQKGEVWFQVTKP